MRFLGLLDALCQWVLVRPTGVSVTVSAGDEAARTDQDSLPPRPGPRLRAAALAFGLPGEWPEATPPCRVVKERRATPRHLPGPPPDPPRLPLPNLALAGDWTDTVLPATIEAAIRSGQVAAHAPCTLTPRPRWRRSAWPSARDGPLSLDRRRALLEALVATLLRHAEAIAAAIDADFGGRSREETLLAEVKLVVDAARHARRHLRRWARPRRVGVPFPFRPACARQEPVPKGVIGIMAPWNYPLQLALMPAVDALAAGNRIAVKPSEATPRIAALLEDLLREALGEDIARVVQGGTEVAARFAGLPWDHLVFTGGTETGRLVMRAAAANLVPLTLELGGKCPVVVLPGADLAAAARAILIGKVVNAGQTCIAPDTVLLLGHARADFIAACRATGLGLAETAVVNGRQAARLDGAAGRGGADAAGGGWPRPAPRPGAGRGAARTTGCMRRRSSAPPWPWCRCRTSPRPSAGSPPGRRRWRSTCWAPTGRRRAAIAAGTRSGAIVEGRCLEYAAFPALPFGGVGASGFGRRNGEEGFLAFSSLRARVEHGRWSLSRLLDPPRGARGKALIRRILR